MTTSTVHICNYGPNPITIFYNSKLITLYPDEMLEEYHDYEASTDLLLYSGKSLEIGVIDATD